MFQTTPTLATTEQQQIRLVGLSNANVPDPNRQAVVKLGAIYRALAKSYHISGIVSSKLPRLNEYMIRLMTFHPDREAWRHRAALNVQAFQQRSRIADRQLQALDGTFDLIFQQRGLSTPGLDLTRWPYVLHLDNTYGISEELYPVWAPLRGRERQRWIDLERNLYQHATAIFAMTTLVRNSLITTYGCDPNKVIRVGIGATMISETIEDHQYDRQVALFVGNDFKRKGGFVLLKAWELIAAAFPKAELWIVGPRGNPPTLPPQVRWIGRVNDRAELSRLYRSASFFVLPSLFEPWGHVYLEAMGHGLPILATTSCCALPEIVASQDIGRLVASGEVQPLADALIEFFGNPALLERMGAQAFSFVRQQYTWDAIVQQMAPHLNAAVRR